MLFKEVAPSIVKLVLVQENLVTEGTGFVVRNQSSGELVIVTANHVAKCNETSQALSQHAFFNSSDYFPSARKQAFLNPPSNTKFRVSVLSFSVQDDYCFLRLPDGAPFIPPLEPSLEVSRGKVCSRTTCFCNSKKATNLPLQQVFVVGFPGFGSALTLSEGLISQVDPHQHRFRILSDGVTTTQGGPGGPLLRKDRSFVGVVLAVDQTTGNFVEVLPYWKLMPFLV